MQPWGWEPDDSYLLFNDEAGDEDDEEEEEEADRLVVYPPIIQKEIDRYKEEWMKKKYVLAISPTSPPWPTTPLIGYRIDYLQFISPRNGVGFTRPFDPSHS